MITTINEWKKLNESNNSEYIQLLDLNGDVLLYGTNYITKAELIDSSGIRVDFLLDNGCYIRVSDDNTIYLLINGEARECRFNQYDTNVIINYIGTSVDLYDYPGVRPFIIQVLEDLKYVQIQNENLNKRKLRLITENKVQEKTIINVDIQPEYEKYITFNFHNWVNFINNNAALNNIVFLYNGADTLGMIDEYSYKEWLIESGIDEDVIDNATFYDKGYAFFRSCIDSNIPEESIVNLIKFMIKYNINDSRDITTKFWKKFKQEYKEDDYGVTELTDLLNGAGDMINIPDLMDFLKDYSNIILLGGGVTECLKEVEIALLSLNKPFKILSQFTY